MRVESLESERVEFGVWRVDAAWRLGFQVVGDFEKNFFQMSRNEPK